MNGDPNFIGEAAELAGIAFETADAFGHHTQVSLETQEAVLEGLGLPVSTSEKAAESIDRLRRLRSGLLPPLIAVTVGEASRLPLNGSLPSSGVEWTLTDAESGAAVGEGRSGLEDAGDLNLPALGPGYYRLRLLSNAVTATATLIAAPTTCYLPPALGGDVRLWGVTAQLVALRTATDFGAGDFGSVREAVARVAPFGASFLGLSPVHALFASDRERYGPYGPSSRLMLDPMHIDVSEFAFGEGVTPPDDLRVLPLADHAGVWNAKLPILERAFANDADRAASVPEAVEMHALFEALSEYFAAQGLASMHAWPPAYRDPTSPEVTRFRSEFADRVRFHAWLQVVADRQLAEAAAEAKRVGMLIGLYADLAVGAASDGSEVWSSPDRYARHLSIGAPPDPLAPHGQDWGIVPLNPITLDEDGLAGFRALIAANMRRSGALRIDHAFQLRRLFLKPVGETGGAYVDYPLEALLACLRLESHRAECMVIGEDLGTAPNGFSDRMMDSGALSYRVLFFERGDGGRFKRPAEYPETAVAVFTTHDLPTIRGWWEGKDIEVRHHLGLMDDSEADAGRRLRLEDRRHLMEALREEGLLSEDEAPAEPPIDAIVRYIARARSMLAALQLEDVVGEVDQANLPGTVAGHPNWRRRLSLELAEIADPAGPLAPLARSMRAEGR